MLAGETRILKAEGLDTHYYQGIAVNRAAQAILRGDGLNAYCANDEEPYLEPLQTFHPTRYGARWRRLRCSSAAFERPVGRWVDG
jgi:hypothetical protein